MAALPDLLLQKFARVANAPPREEKDVIVYGTVSISGEGTENEEINVTLDGSEVATPVTSTCIVKDADRVTVLIKNHKAVITGNITKPAATNVDLETVNEAAQNGISDVAGDLDELAGAVNGMGTAIDTVRNTAQEALTSANGKSRNFYQASPPDPQLYDLQVGSSWWDTDDDNTM